MPVPDKRKNKNGQASLLDTLGRTDLRAIDYGLRGLSSQNEGDLMLGGSSVFSDDEEDSDDSDSDEDQDDGFGNGNGSESGFSSVGGGGGGGGISVYSSEASNGGGGGAVADLGWGAEWNSLGDASGGNGNRNSKGKGKTRIANNGKTTAARRAVAERQAPSTSSLVAAAMIRRSASASTAVPPSSSSSASSKRRSRREGGGSGGVGGGSRLKAGGGVGKKRGGGGGGGGGVSAPVQQLARVSTDGVDGDDSDSDRDVSGVIERCVRAFIAGGNWPEAAWRGGTGGMNGVGAGCRITLVCDVLGSCSGIPGTKSTLPPSPCGRAVLPSMLRGA